MVNCPIFSESGTKGSRHSEAGSEILDPKRPCDRGNGHLDSGIS
jgi:hypothetical protein